ncbi:hypothetical protein AA313_de0202355 [Arthrobotrys entomopaga]|nr:hypothetical protein AA313_de0202355 [Arthrobotrys entomopaga]
MVELKISPAVAVAILAGVSQVSAHCRFLQVVGSTSPGIKGGALGHLYQFAVKKGNTQYPYQWDTTVFSNPPVPPCCTSPYKKTKRVWEAQGCGADLHNVFDYWSKRNPKAVTPAGKKGTALWNYRNYNFFQRPLILGAYIQTDVELKKNAAAGRIAKVKCGGTLTISVYQVNSDGAGPFRCRIDSSGTGNHFTGWLPEVDYVIQPPGTKASYSVNHGSSSASHNLRVKIPLGTKCRGTVGKYKNVCIMRCENYAKNGPFGGCIPFQLDVPPPPKPVTRVTHVKSIRPVVTIKPVITIRPPVVTFRPTRITRPRIIIKTVAPIITVVIEPGKVIPVTKTIPAQQQTVTEQETVTLTQTVTQEQVTDTVQMTETEQQTVTEQQTITEQPVETDQPTGTETDQVQSTAVVTSLGFTLGTGSVEGYGGDSDMPATVMKRYAPRARRY